MMRARATLAALVAAGLVAAACSGEAADDPTDDLSAVPLDPSAGATTDAPSGAPTDGTAAPSASPTAAPTDEPILLTDHGLTILNLGAALDDALTALQAAFGTPSEDTGWQEGHQTGFGVCPGDATRGVRWGGLWAIFFRNAPDAPGEWLAAYQLSGFESPDMLGITTPRGITIGATRTEMEAAYGADAEFIDGEPLFDGIVELTDTVPGTTDQATLFGTMDGLDPDSTLIYLQAGQGCGE